MTAENYNEETKAWAKQKASAYASQEESATKPDLIEAVLYGIDLGLDRSQKSVHPDQYDCSFVQACRCVIRRMENPYSGQKGD